MQKKIRIVLLVILAVFLSLQLIPKTLNQSSEVLKTDFIEVYQPPVKVTEVLQKACYDCHSSNTKYPWYNKIQPVALFLEDHINEAKGKLNFSEFSEYSVKKQKHKIEEVIEEVEEGEMPLFAYELMHSEAKMDPADREAFIHWMKELKEKL